MTLKSNKVFLFFCLPFSSDRKKVFFSGGPGCGDDIDQRGSNRMSGFITDNLFQQYRDLIYAQSGIHFSHSNRSILESRLRERLKFLEIEKPEKYLHKLQTDGPPWLPMVVALIAPPCGSVQPAIWTLVSTVCEGAAARGSPWVAMLRELLPPGLFQTPGVAVLTQPE